MNKKLNAIVSAKIEADNKFEADVIYQLEVLGEMTTSDAQGVLEAHDFLFMQLLCGDMSAVEVAKAILAN